MCGRSNRMVVKGVYSNGDKTEIYPDIGYSFCNCHAIFYTRYENVTGPKTVDPPFILIPFGDEVTITQPDPFFCEWGQDPYKFTHWNPRKHQVLWDMESLVDYLPSLGYEVLNYRRDFDVHSMTPQHYHIEVRRK